MASRVQKKKTSPPDYAAFQIEITDVQYSECSEEIVNRRLKSMLL